MAGGQSADASARQSPPHIPLGIALGGVVRQQLGCRRISVQADAAMRANACRSGSRANSIMFLRGLIG